MSEQWSIKRMLDWCTNYFIEKGIEDSPRLDAEILLSHTLGIRRLDLYLQFDRPLSQDELQNFKAIVKRRVDHEPVAYIVGKKEFWSLDFFVTPDVLIPRPDTEILVEKTLEILKQKTDLRQGLEIGVGSGCLSIALLSEVKDLKITAVEVSEEAITIARKNAEYHGVADRLEIVHRDFLKSSSGDYVDVPFDFLVSNPPYAKEAEKDSISKSVKDFEPEGAIFAGETGLIFYEEIQKQYSQLIRPEGFVIMEIGEDQGNAVQKLFSGSKILKDLAGHDRVVLLDSLS